MKLIVGLGNIGKEFEKTRHNVGFMAIDEIASTNHVTLSKEKFGGLYTIFEKETEKIMLLKPQRYINLSGEVIFQYMRFFKIDLEDLLIIHDDLDLPVGSFRLKKQGSSGGHNGLKNIEFYLKTKSYKRIKIGISNNKKIDTKDYVLGHFNKEETIKVESMINLMSSIIDDYLKLSFDNLMNKYNKK